MAANRLSKQKALKIFDVFYRDCEDAQKGNIPTTVPYWYVGQTAHEKSEKLKQFHQFIDSWLIMTGVIPTILDLLTKDAAKELIDDTEDCREKLKAFGIKFPDEPTE